MDGMDGMDVFCGVQPDLLKLQKGSIFPVCPGSSAAIPTILFPPRPGFGTHRLGTDRCAFAHFLCTRLGGQSRLLPFGMFSC